MKFELIPILSKIEALYQMPPTRDRFDAYLLMLQGSDKEDMILPIASYNPMAKKRSATTDTVPANAPCRTNH